MQTILPKSNEDFWVFGEGQGAGDAVVWAGKDGLGIQNAGGYVVKAERPLAAHARHQITHNTKNRTHLRRDLIQELCSVQMPSFYLQKDGREELSNTD